MVMMPKRVKYRRSQKGKCRGLATTGAELAFGEFGLKCLENGRIKNTQIESVRVILARQLHKGGKLWIRIFPDKPITKKPLEVRQGKGKGNVEYWVASVQPGRILFKIEGISEALAREAFTLASAKLPIGTTFVSRKMV